MTMPKQLQATAMYRQPAKQVKIEFETRNQFLSMRRCQPMQLSRHYGHMTLVVLEEVVVHLRKSISTIRANMNMPLIKRYCVFELARN